MKAEAIGQYSLSGWVFLSAVLHIAIFILVNHLYLGWIRFEPAHPLVIDVSIESPPVLPEPSTASPATPQAQAPVQNPSPPLPEKKRFLRHAPRQAAPQTTASKEFQETETATGNSSDGQGSSTGRGIYNASPQDFGNPKPPYPEAARRAHKEGTVVLSVRVGTDGSVSSIEISQTSGTSVLDSTAQQTVMQWRFVPARLKGAPVESTVLVPIKFQLTDHPE